MNERTLLENLFKDVYDKVKNSVVEITDSIKAGNKNDLLDMVRAATDDVKKLEILWKNHRDVFYVYCEELKGLGNMIDDACGIYGIMDFVVKEEMGRLVERLRGMD